MPQLMWTTDRAGRIDWVNLRWSEYAGRPFDEVPIDQDDLFALVHADDRASVNERWASAQVTGEPI